MKILMKKILILLNFITLTALAMQTEAPVAKKAKKEPETSLKEWPRIYVNDEEIKYSPGQIKKVKILNNPEEIGYFTLDTSKGKISFFFESFEIKGPGKRFHHYTGFDPDPNIMEIWFDVNSKENYFNPVSSITITKEMVEEHLGKDASIYFSRLPREIREEIYKFYKLIQ
jgi:hypothetical protein